jgi:class 3 adenylate cyclase
MFCDLVDSTGIAAKLDAEEWRDLVGAYLDAGSAAVVEMGGKVAKKLGDGLMALFGHPVAQENHAERAVRAALAIQRALAELNRANENTGKPAPLRALPSTWGRLSSTRRARFSVMCPTSQHEHRP